MSKKRRAEHAVRSVVQHELRSAMYDLRNGDADRALSNLRNAERKLVSAADDIHRIKEAD